MSKAVTYTHENGYSARLYGESSLSIYYDGKEVMHTCSRNVNTESEVMELLEKQPKLRESLAKMINDEEQVVYPSYMGMPISTLHHFEGKWGRMGRLIDADDFIKLLKANTMSNGTLINTNTMLAIVEQMPTAYDIDKVVTEIEEMFGVDPMYYGAEARWSVDKAIEIVKAGGTQ